MSTSARSATSPAARSVSQAPDGRSFEPPLAEETDRELAALAADADEARARGASVVAVQGLGFVGTAVAVAIAAARDSDDQPRHLVVGVDLATPDAYWKVGSIAAGDPPFAVPDPELAALLRQAVLVDRNLRAIADERAYALADVVVVDVQLDTEDEGVVRLAPFEAAMRAIGRTMRADALVVLETTVPVGTCEQIVAPLLEEERRRRGIDTPALLAFAYERVMPGPRYVSSVRAFPRTFAGTTPEATTRARAFLSSFVDVERHPLWELPDTASAELAKLLENSYRAANIAFIHEWTLLAEQAGIDLFEVVDSIRVRSGTHDNMRYPGLGVGGYCLPKDPLLAEWGVRELLGGDSALPVTLDAVRTNVAMPLHTRDLVLEVGGELSGYTVALCGVAYLSDVADTRNSPSATLLDELLAAGAAVVVHDPVVTSWPEREDQRVVQDLGAALAAADGIVLAVPHTAYRLLGAEELLALAPRARFVVDAQNVIGDDVAAALRADGRRVVGVGKGHWRRLGYHLAA